MMNFTFFPPVKYIQGDYYKAVSLGFSGQNKPFGIKIVTGVSYALPILAQERAEWAFKYIVGFPVAVLLGVGSFLLGAFWPVSLILAFAGLLWTYKIPGLNRALEYFGQTVELVVAVDWFAADRDIYFHRTAKQLEGYPQMKGMTVSQIENSLRKWEPRCKKWVSAHRNLLIKYENKLKSYPDYKIQGL